MPKTGFTTNFLPHIWNITRNHMGCDLHVIHLITINYAHASTALLLMHVHNLWWYDTDFKVREPCFCKLGFGIWRALVRQSLRYSGCIVISTKLGLLSSDIPAEISCGHSSGNFFHVLQFSCDPWLWSRLHPDGRDPLLGGKNNNMNIAVLVVNYGISNTIVLEIP